jgi:hypothetical protein
MQQSIELIGASQILSVGGAIGICETTAVSILV